MPFPNHFCIGLPELVPLQDRQSGENVLDDRRCCVTQVEPRAANRVLLVNDHAQLSVPHECQSRKHPEFVCRWCCEAYHCFDIVCSHFVNQSQIVPFYISHAVLGAEFLAQLRERPPYQNLFQLSETTLGETMFSLSYRYGVHC